MPPPALGRGFRRPDAGAPRAPSGWRLLALLSLALLPMAGGALAVMPNVDGVRLTFGKRIPLSPGYAAPVVLLAALAFRAWPRRTGRGRRGDGTPRQAEVS